jgi:crotonobetainyl-CoA:carnitine CoA-transferase CaiB-like acyl-CoA transferase
MEILSGVRVVEIAEGIAGPYCGKLLADAGARVVKVERPGGDPLRRRAVHGETLPDDEDAALFRYLNAGKGSVVGAPGDPEVDALVAEADIVIDGFVPAALDVGAVRAAHPRLVVVSVTPYGRGGEWETRPSTEFTVQAEAAGILGRGLLDEPPVQAGGRIGEWVCGTYAAVGAMIAALHARRTGAGEHVDVSQLEATTLTYTVFRELSQALSGAPPTGPARMVERPSVEPTKDGWVGFNTNTRTQLDSFMVLIERPDLLDDPRFTNALARRDNGEVFDELVRAWTREHTTAEIVERATILRIPVAPVLDGPGVLAHPHFRARGVIADAPDGTFEQPLGPYKVDGERPRPRGRAPRVGAGAGAAADAGTGARPGPPEHAGAARELPLAGLRVLDATAWWAGPSSTQLLAYLGADVIHLESITRPDGARMVAPPGDHFWEKSGLYLGCNSNKRSVTLALDDPRGLERVMKLIESVDAVVENFSPRVFDRFGLTWETIHAINPRAILVRMPAFGLDGPWRDNVGFAQTMEQMSGMAWVTGYPDKQPRIPLGPCDPNAGTHATFALLVALWRREQTGEGSFVEATMVESALNVSAEQSVVSSAYGVTPMRMGNRGPDAAPQNLYRCAGEDEWLALAVASDAHWSALVEVLGRPAWATDPALAGVAGRRAAHDRIDAELGAWLADRDAAATAALLLAAGVPAARAADPRRTSEHERHRQRRWFEAVEHPVNGRMLLPGPPFRFASIETWTRTRPPLLGEHTEALLAGELAEDPAEYAELEAAGVVGTAPAAV